MDVWVRDASTSVSQVGAYGLFLRTERAAALPGKDLNLRLDNERNGFHYNAITNGRYRTVHGRRAGATNVSLLRHGDTWETLTDLPMTVPFFGVFWLPLSDARRCVGST